MPEALNILNVTSRPLTSKKIFLKPYIVLKEALKNMTSLLNSFAFLTIGVMRQKLSFFCSCKMDLGRLAPAPQRSQEDTIPF
jgi:hypothetical protein